MTGASRVPALDGIRGIAILLVLIGHGLGQPGEWPSAAGVTLFFILSGYLITGRLASGQSLPRFYANRARRLLPAMLVMLAVTAPYFLSVGRASGWQVLEAGLYVRDITAGHLGASLYSPWSHMWSLAVEEQFYLLWPLAFAWRWRGRGLLVVGCLSLAVWIAAHLAGDFPLGHFSPLTQAWALCLGCWLALRGWAPSWPSWLSARWLCWFGTRSYGMYLWHYPLMVAATMVLPRSVALPVGVVLGVGAAVLSWRYVESPWLRSARRSVPVPSPARTR